MNARFHVTRIMLLFVAGLATNLFFVAMPTASILPDLWAEDEKSPAVKTAGELTPAEEEFRKQMTGSVLVGVFRLMAGQDHRKKSVMRFPKSGKSPRARQTTLCG